MPKRSKRRDEQGTELGDLLQVGAAWAAVSRVLERSLGEAGISLSQALTLLVIASASQPLLLNQLAARLLQRPASMTSLMDRLEQAGWAKRVQDLPDRRAIRVEITEAGAAKAANVGPRLVVAATQVLAGLDEPATSGLQEGLTALYEACRMQPGMRLPARWEQ